MGQQLERPGALRVQGNDTAGIRWLRGQLPQDFYPPDAKAQGIDGLAIVDLLLNAEGAVLEAALVSESPPDQGFGLAALDTAKTYEFDNTFRRLVLMKVTIEFLP